MADALLVHDKDSVEQMQQCLARALFIFTKGFKSASNDSRVQILIDISHLWDRIMCGRSEGEKILVLEGLIGACIKEFRKHNGADNDKFIDLICTGYVLWFYKICAGKSLDTNISPQETLLLRLRNEIDIMRLHFLDNTNDIRSVDIVFVFLVWMHFLCGDIRLREDLLKHTLVRNEDYDSLHAVAQCLFSGVDCDQYFEIAFHQTLLYT